jgi:hypothetical protein
VRELVETVLSDLLDGLWSSPSRGLRGRSHISPEGVWGPVEPWVGTPFLAVVGAVAEGLAEGSRSLRLRRPRSFALALSGGGLAVARRRCLEQP